MKIDVSDLLKEVGSELKVEAVEEFSFPEEDIKLCSPVTVKLKLVNTGQTVLVTGSLKARVMMSCGRCLKEFEHPVDIKIEEEYCKSGSQAAEDEWEEEDGEREVELKDKDFVFEISEQNVLDLDEAIRQNIIVSLPIKAICSKDCKVPVLKKESKKVLDPRLAKLKEINITGGK
jgi:uncharacterized protein